MSVAVAVNPGFFAQLPDRKAEILQHAFKTEADDVVACFFQTQGAAELPPCGVLRGLRRQSFDLQLFFRVLAVESHFLFQFAIEFFAAHENPELSEETNRRFHESLLGVLQHTADGRDHLLKL